MVANRCSFGFRLALDQGQAERREIKRRAVRWPNGRGHAVVGLAVALALPEWSSPALAACTPGVPPSQVTCTGTTTGGYANPTSGITVTVVDGAQVSGGLLGALSLTDATVFNYGTIFNNLSWGIAANNLTLHNYASISHSVSTENAVVNNLGTISGDRAINATTSAWVTNSGQISGSFRAVVASTTVVNNSGTISATNTAIEGTSSVTVINSGSVSSTGHSGAGILSNFFSTITVINSGSIRATGTGFSQGIAGAGVGTFATVANSGSIWGAYAGIGVETGNLINSGSITGGEYGLFFRSGGTVTTSGLIRGDAGTAIAFNTFTAAQSDILTILPGARFGGLVDFGSGADQVNFGPGNWVLHTANFDAALSTVATGGNPYFIEPNRIVVADLSGFGAMNRALMDMTGWIASVLPELPVSEHVQQDDARNAFAMSLAAPRLDDAAADFSATLPFAPTPVFQGGSMRDMNGNNYWAQAFGGRREQDTENSFIGSVTRGYGAAVGVDGQVTASTRLGFLAGGSINQTSLSLNAGQIDTDTLFGGVYSRTIAGPGFLDLAVIGGSLDNSSKRNIGGGLAMETANASYGGWFITPLLTFGHRFALGDNLIFTPALKARYVAAHFDGYTESGSSANLVVSDRDFRAWEERFELSLASRQRWDGNQITIRTHIGTLAQQRAGDSALSIALLGQNFLTTTPDQAGVFGLYGGGGFEWQSNHVSLFASGQVAAMNDESISFAGRGGIRFVW